METTVGKVARWVAHIKSAEKYYLLNICGNCHDIPEEVNINQFLTDAKYHLSDKELMEKYSMEIFGKGFEEQFAEDEWEENGNHSDVFEIEECYTLTFSDLSYFSVCFNAIDDSPTAVLSDPDKGLAEIAYEDFEANEWDMGIDMLMNAVNTPANVYLIKGANL